MPPAASIFEPRPRFRGCPPICLAANLPSHETEAAAEAWLSMHHGLRKDKWRCKHCNLWHIDGRCGAPSGSSSSTTRDSDYPTTPFEPFVRESTKRLHQKQEMRFELGDNKILEPRRAAGVSSRAAAETMI